MKPQKFVVKTTVWNVGDYRLKKGDIVTKVNETVCSMEINFAYFVQPIWVEKNDLEVHCVESN